MIASLGACAAKAAEARKGALLLLLHRLAPLGLLLDLLPAHEAEPARFAGRGQGCRGGGGSVRARGRIGGGDFLQHIALRLAAPCEEAQPRLDHGAAVRVRVPLPLSFASSGRRSRVACVQLSHVRGERRGSEASGRGAAGTMGCGAVRCGGQRARTGLLGRRAGGAASPVSNNAARCTAQDRCGCNWGAAA